MRSKFKWIFTLLMAFTMQFSFAQEKTIKGNVTDAMGPMPGVNVVVQGTQRGTQTDFDGSYSIKANVGETLVFSYLGMRDVSRVVDASGSINIVMQDDAKQLGEVVVTGSLGIKKKRDALTATQQVVDNKELTQAVNPNVVRSLAGKVSGLQINTTSGGVNGATRIQMRGFRSMTGNNEALVVIDNSISTAAILQTLPPEIIESINVIKGAQGAALYGEQGSNGVLIVTTKKGAKGDNKLTISVNSSVDFEDISFLPERQKRYGQGWDGDQVYYENGGWGAPLTGQFVDTGLPQANGLSYSLPYSPVKGNNIKDYYQLGTTYQTGATLNFSGSDAYALLSANRQTSDFIVQGDELKRNSFIFKAGKKFGNWSVDGNVNYISTITNQSDAENTLLQLLQTASNIPVGMFENSGPDQGWNAYYANPFWVRKNDRLDRNNDFFNGSVTLGYKFNDHIDVSYLANIQTNSINQQQYSNEFVDDNNPGGGDNTQQSSYFNSFTNSRNYYGDLLINFNYDLTDNISFKMNIGNNIQDRLTKTISQGGTDLEIDGWYHIQNVINPLQPRQLTNNTVQSRRFSNFANIDLGFKDYLFLNLTGRGETSSSLIYIENGQFRQKSATYFYPSAGLSFIPTKAFAALRDKETFSYFKVFANLTRVGNSSPVNSYNLDQIGTIPNGFPFGPLSSYVYNGAPTNITTKPEYVNTFEVGTNLGFFNNRLTLDASVYKAKIENLISNVGASSASGVNTLRGNIGDMENKGVELDLGFTPFKSENFTWSGRVGYSAYETEITALAGGAEEVQLFNGSTVSNIVGGIYAVVGESFPMIKGTTFQRDPNGNVIVGSNGVPLINSQLSNLGKATPDYILNFSNSLDYKGLKLTVSGDYRNGGYFLSETKYNLAWSGHLVESAEFDRDLGFIYPGSVVETAPGSGEYTANTSVVSAAGYAAGTGVIDYYGAVSRVGEFNLIDATALKIREVALSYQLPSKITDKLGIASLRFGVNARNPFIKLADGNEGYADPEGSNFFSAANTNNAVRATTLNTSLNGIGYIQTGQYPSTKTYGFSVNLTF